MEPFAYCLFCDDIRYELRHKLSLIGLYSGPDLVFPVFPFTLSKLCVLLHASFPEAPPRKITTRILKDGDILAESNADLDPKALEEGAITLGDGRMLAYQQLFELPFLTIDGPCLIRGRVIADGKEIKAGGISIRLASPAEKEEMWPNLPGNPSPV